jgi:D-threo-aldose 1-dehydrogenase
MNTNHTSIQEQGKQARQVSKVGMGTAVFASVLGYQVTEEQALETLRALFQSPINYLDTAAGYGDGESERRIGLALRERGGLPKNSILSTKIDADARTRDYSGEQAKRSLARSLELLGLDHFQLVFLHDPEYSTWEILTAKGGAVDVLRDYKEQGIISAIGVAGGPIDLMIQYLELGGFDAVLSHNRYTLLNRSAEKLWHYGQAHGLTMFNAAPYGSGILARGPEAYPRYMYRPADQIIIERTKKMRAICDEYGVPLAAAALQFSTRDPRLTSTIVGMSKPQRITETLGYLDMPIPDELWSKLDAVGFETKDI